MCAYGLVIVGDRVFIAQFKMNMKMLGAILPKPAIMARAGLTALKTMPQEIVKDNQIAKLIASSISQIEWL